MARIDHFMYAAPSLDLGMEWAADTFDAQPVYGGAHVGLGTCNALLSLGDTYLEIIAPDPQQSLENNFGGQLAALKTGGLVTWAASGALDEIAKRLASFDIVCIGPRQTQRQTSNGDTLTWSLLFPKTRRFGNALPFFIDWQACPHPATTNPIGGALLDMQIFSPDSETLQAVFKKLQLPVPVPVRQGEANLSLTIGCKKGEVTLSCTDATRLLRLV